MMPFSRSLVVKLVVSMLLITLITLGITGISLFNGAQAFINKSFVDRLDVIADLKTAELSMWLDEQYNTAILISQLPPVEANIPRLVDTPHESLKWQSAYDATATLCTTIIEAHPDIREILVLSIPGGEVIYSTEKSHQGDYRTDDTFFAHGMIQPYTQKIYPWPVTTRPTITVAMPISDQQQLKPAAVLAFHLNLDILDDVVLSSDELPLTGEIYLVDGYNNFVSSQRIDRGKYPRGVHSHGIDQAVLHRQNGSGVYENYAGQRVLGVYRWIDNISAALIVEIPETTILQPGKNMLTAIYLIGMLNVVLLTLGTFLIFRPVSNSLAQIQGVAERAATGDLSQTARVSSQDEIGQLAAVFNRMVTELRTLYDNLRRERDLMARIMFTSPSGIIRMDRRGAIVFANARAKRIMGLTTSPNPGEFFKVPEWSLFDMDGRPLLDDQTPFAQSMLRRQPVLDEELQLLWPNERLVYLSVNVAPLFDDSGEIDGVVSTVDDITNRKQYEQEIQALNTQLEKRVRERTAQLELSNQELEAFSYSVSHDLRAPLRAISGFSGIVLREHQADMPEGAVRYLGLIQENAQRMGRLIDDLLAFSRSSRQDLKKVSVDLMEVCARVLADLDDERRERNIEVTIQPLPPAFADETLIQQVFANLLSNAFKFTRQADAPRVEIGHHIVMDEIIYYIKDNGVGFDMEYVNKLFGVFQRLHPNEFEGTGIGLANVKRIITRHGGRVWAVAETGKGATFYFSLPS